jgi:hypothetical protein
MIRSLQLLSLQLLSLLLISQLLLSVRGAALTTAISANERICFYAEVDKAGEKIGVRLFLSLPFSHFAVLIVSSQFYFAVRVTRHCCAMLYIYVFPYRI